MSQARKFDTPMTYSIRVRGRLDPKWSDWFDGFTFLEEGSEDTVMVGRVSDQAALYGVLAKIRDLGLPLLGVTCLDCQTEVGDTGVAGNPTEATTRACEDDGMC